MAKRKKADKFKARKRGFRPRHHNEVVNSGPTNQVSALARSMQIFAYSSHLSSMGRVRREPTDTPKIFESETIVYGQDLPPTLGLELQVERYKNIKPTKQFVVNDLGNAREETEIDPAHPAARVAIKINEFYQTAFHQGTDVFIPRVLIDNHKHSLTLYFSGMKAMFVEVFKFTGEVRQSIVYRGKDKAMMYYNAERISWKGT